MAFNERENTGMLPQPATFRAANLNITNGGEIEAQIELLAPTTTEPALPVMADFLFWQVTMNWADNEGNILHDPASDMKAIVAPRPSALGSTMNLKGIFAWNPTLHATLPWTLSLDLTWVRVYGFGKPKSFHVWPGNTPRELAGANRVGTPAPSIAGDFFTHSRIEMARAKGGDYDYLQFIATWMSSHERETNQCALAEAADCDNEPGCNTLAGTTWNESMQCQLRAVGCMASAIDCGAAETRGIGPDGICMHFHSTCQPPGFSRADSCPFEPAGASPLSCP